MAAKRSHTLWFTGIPESGKTTLARMLHTRLAAQGVPVELLDSDEAYVHFRKVVGSTPADRELNTRCIGYVCSLLNRNGILAVVAATAHGRMLREHLRCHIENFVEIYCDCPVSVAAARDSKGLYRLARAGLIDRFVGVDQAYEPSDNPEVWLKTGVRSKEACESKLLDYLYEKRCW